MVRGRVLVVRGKAAGTRPRYLTWGVSVRGAVRMLGVYSRARSTTALYLV